MMTRPTNIFNSVKPCDVRGHKGGGGGGGGGKGLNFQVECANLKIGVYQFMKDFRTTLMGL